MAKIYPPPRPRGGGTKKGGIMFNQYDEYLDAPVGVVFSTTYNSELVCNRCAGEVEDELNSVWDKKRPLTYVKQLRTRRFLNVGDRCAACGKVLRE